MESRLRSRLLTRRPGYGAKASGFARYTAKPFWAIRSAAIAGHFRPRRHRLTAAAYRETRAERFATWRAVTGTPAMA